jgi:transposase
MAVDAALLDRAGELKRELVAFSRQPRYDRAFSEVLARHGGGSEVLNEHRLMMLWDYFALEHRLRNGRTIVELAIGTQRHLWEQRLAALLLGAPRHGRIRQPREDNPGQALPGGKIYLSFPGLGDRLAARVAGEIGDHPQQFGSPNALACYAGKAPVTRRSGKSELVVATRLACNRYLADAVQQWAFCSLRYSGWAREFYDLQRARGKTHHAALRALGNRWLEILWHCLMRGQLYDEATHVANRNRALGKAA